MTRSRSHRFHIVLPHVQRRRGLIWYLGAVLAAVLAVACVLTATGVWAVVGAVGFSTAAVAKMILGYSLRN